MDGYSIRLTLHRRSDGSVCIMSRDLPMFSVVGDDEKAALELAAQLLPEYMHANGIPTQ